MTVVDTKGVIFPGLIDGHNHVEYNHIGIADLGKRFQNRNQWPNVQLYQTLVKDPKNAVADAGIQCEALRHAEARALVGGTTGIQGTPATSCARSLVRNIEATNFCQDKVRQNVMSISGFGRSISGKPSFADSIKTDIAANRLDAFAVHMAEGIDEVSRAEWDDTEKFELDVEQLVMIHSTGLTEAEFIKAGAVGAKTIWSPLSNLLLYGKTTDVPTAMKHGVTVAIGTDWSPSGSANLLWELPVAKHVNDKLWGGSITDKQLVDMVTINPAKAYGLDKFVGSLEVGKYADLLVISKASGQTPEQALISMKPQWVKLVTISGDPLYGDVANMEALGKTGDFETVDACGTQKGIDMTVTAKDVEKGDMKLSQVEESLKAINPGMTPVIDCENDEALQAYAGTAAE
jgi:imidazolonepropionase-like amidohydrolase